MHPFLIRIIVFLAFLSATSLGLPNQLFASELSPPQLPASQLVAFPSVAFPSGTFQPGASHSVVSQSVASQVYTFGGTTPVGTSAALVTVTVTFGQAGLLATSKVLTQGSPNLDFKDAGGGSCSPGTTYTTGQTCTVVVLFSPLVPGGRAGAIVLADAANNALATTFLYGTGTGGLSVLIPAKILTAAGSYSFVFSGDGGSALNAGLKLPTGLAIDGAGNFYLTDGGHNRVRRVSVNGTITTIAGNGSSTYQGDGGPATATGLNAPAALALDGAGNLYISDTGNHAIRILNLASGVITTVAGNNTQGYSGDLGPATAASLNTPEGLALDQRGTLDIADTANNAIRAVNLVTGIITTVAGKGAPGFSGDGGPANAALLDAPWNVATDNAGRLYIADSANNRVRSVDASGIIGTIAGTGVPALTGDGGPATASTVNLPSGLTIDAAGNVYIADTGNDCIRKVNGATGIITTVVGPAGENYNGDGFTANTASVFAPYSIALDAKGNLYIADSFHNRIREVIAASAVIFPQGKLQVGKTSPTTVEAFENDGNAPLTISAITVNTNAKVDPAATTCAAAELLASGQACAVGVQAAPTVAGNPIIGSVTLASDASNSPAVIQIAVNAVNPTATTTVLTVSTNPSALGVSITFAATVTGTGGPTGTVTFLDGSTSLGTGTLDSQGRAFFSTNTLALGPHSITASYGGDIANLSSVSPVLTQVVVEPTKITVASNVNPSLAGLPVNFTATVIGSGGIVPTGLVTFTDGGLAIGSAPLDANGTASFQTAALAGGTHAIEADYPGDRNTAPGTSVALIQTVISTVTGTDLLVSGTALNFGQSLTLTSVVAGSRGVEPTGVVTFFNGTTVLGTATLDSKGVATFTFVPDVGVYNLTASYGGDSIYAVSLSQKITVNVNYVADFTMAATPPSLTIKTGKNATITVTISSTHGFTDKIGLGCSSMPARSNCTFSQNSFTLAAGASKTVSLTVNTFPLNLAGLASPHAFGSAPSGVSLALVLPGGLLFAAIALFTRRKKNKWGTLLLFALTATAIGTINGCGGSTLASTPPGTYTAQINAVGSTTTHSIPLQLTVTQ